MASVGLRGFIDRFWQNKFPPKSRYGVQTRLRALLEPAINIREFGVLDDKSLIRRFVVLYR